MRIDIISDTVCPWCFVGKRRLEQALSMRPELNPTITWHPFQLNPEMPAEGVDRKTYLDSKFGGPEGAERVYGVIREAGAAEDIAFNFDAIAVTPNSIDSHRVIHWADGDNKQDAVVEALFRGYFLEGANIGDPKVLADTADSCGMTERLSANVWRAQPIARLSSTPPNGHPQWVCQGCLVLSWTRNTSFPGLKTRPISCSFSIRSSPSKANRSRRRRRQRPQCPRAREGQVSPYRNASST